MKNITYKEYINKALGAWAGKCAGGIIGAKQENNKSIMNYTFENVFPDNAPPNDDFDLQILYLNEVLEKVGFNFTSVELADAFAEYNRCWANEYRVAIKNIQHGIYPPMSGKFNNDFFNSSMGCPIRSELWALVSPGNPEFAVELSRLDGCIDHTIESIEGEKFYAALQSLAFFETDIIKLINNSLKFISKKSLISKTVNFVLNLFHDNIDWLSARQLLEKNFGSSDASYAPMNIGITILALLYGGKNFENTMLMAVNCGYDTDCTSATAGAILGIINGYDAIPKSWQEKIGDDFIVGTVDVKRERNKLTLLAEDTFSLAYSLSRDALTQIEFLDIPKDFVCATPKYIKKPTIEVEYIGAPELLPNKKAHARITVTNCTDKTFEFETSITSADYLGVESDLHNFTIEAKQTKIFNVAVKCLNRDFLPNKNIINICFKSEFLTIDRKIGFAGASKFRIIGSFFDYYDTQKYDHDINDGKTPPTVFGMFNGFVNLERAYCNEQTFPENERDIVFYTAKDKLPIEKYIKYKGACCVYVVNEFYCEEEQDVYMFLGYSSPFKLFVNGKEHWAVNEFDYWTTVNCVAWPKLKKGLNQIVYKLIRKNGKFEFSSMFSKKETTFESMSNGVLPDFSARIK